MLAKFMFLRGVTMRCKNRQRPLRFAYRSSSAIARETVSTAGERFRSTSNGSIGERMSLSVLNNISAMYAENNLNQTQSSLQNTLTQLSSGSRINSGSDDAAGLSVADGLGANEAALTQSAQNAADGVSLLQTADGALSQVNNLLNRAVTLATEASNGTLNSSQISSANAEYQNILTEIGNIGSTTNFNGNSVFTGTATNLVVSDGTSTGTTTFADTVGTLTASSIGLSATNPGTASSLTASAPSSSSAATASTATLTLGSNSDTLSGTLSLAVGSGAATSVSIAANSTLSQVATDINGNSTLSGQGVSASYNSTTHALTISGPAAGSSTLVATSSGLTESNSGSFTLTTPTASSAATASSTTLSLANATNTVGGTFSIAVGSGSPQTLTVAAGTTLASLATKINADSTYASESVTANYNSNTGILTVSGPAGASNTVSTSGTSLQQTTAPTIAATPAAGVDFSNASISNLTASTAQNVLTSLTTAIGDVAYQRGIIGANVNELQAAAQVASVQSENLTSASSAIMSTDYGQATSDMAKYQVLSQTGISALAQANSVQQEVLKLLQ
jgi:flagellin